MARMKKLKLPPITTVIGEETRIEGNLEFAGGMHLDGVVRGDVTARPQSGAALVVSHSGRIQGNVRTDILVLDGTIEGDVVAGERAELAPGAKVTGKVHYRLLEMAMGAEVCGQLIPLDTTESTD